MALSDFICLSTIESAIKQGTTEAYKKNINILTDLINQEAAMSKEVNFQKYRDNIFEKQDFIFYRGIFHFYSLNYIEALNDFESSYTIKKTNDITSNVTIKSSVESMDRPKSALTDLSDVGLCTVNDNEYRLNIVLCYILVFYIFILDGSI